MESYNQNTVRAIFFLATAVVVIGGLVLIANNLALQEAHADNKHEYCYTAKPQNEGCLATSHENCKALKQAFPDNDRRCTKQN